MIKSNNHHYTTVPSTDELATSTGRCAASSEIIGAAADCSGAEVHTRVDYPGLAALRLSDHDLDALRHQGFIATETRGSLTFFKLRFRRRQQQVVRYIGDAVRAEAIRNELALLQADCRLTRELVRVTKNAKRTLRTSKIQLLPIVETEGLKFHGLSLRRPRAAKTRQ